MNEVLLKMEERKNYQKAMILAIFTVAYNFLEGLFATWLGNRDETVALFGFGVDSFIEMISGFGIASMIIRIRQNPTSHRNVFERRALKITGISFYLLAAGLFGSAAITLIIGQKPTTTFWGVVISLISIFIMILLLVEKIRTGKRLNSEAILADASCTKVCIYMSCVLLAASAIYEVTSFSYADALGTIGLGWFSYREGKECSEKANSEKILSSLTNQISSSIVLNNC